MPSDALPVVVQGKRIGYAQPAGDRLRVVLHDVQSEFETFRKDEDDRIFDVKVTNE